MSTNCEITFDNLDGFYNSGDVLNGNVQIQILKLKTIRGISIKILGYGRVFWAENHNDDTTLYTAYENYINSITYVLGSAEGDFFDLTPGIYNYTFNCILPKELPTSCKESAGKIKYKVIVTIDRRLRCDNIFERVFIVNHILDLNMNPEYKLSRLSRNNTNLFGNCNKISGELSILRGGYVPGEEIRFQLMINNDTNIDLPCGKIKLKKCYTFISTGPREKEKKIYEDIEIKKLPSINRRSYKEFNDIFHLSNLPPTQKMKHIQLDYIIKARISLWYLSIHKYEIIIPIIIGTIPINNDTSEMVNVNLNNLITDGILHNLNSELLPRTSSVVTNSSENCNNLENFNNPENVTKINDDTPNKNPNYGWNI